MSMQLDPAWLPGGEHFTGYRIELEDKEAIASESAPYSQLMSAGEWQEGDLFSWFHVRNQSQKNSCRGHSLQAASRICYRIAAGSVDLDGDGIDNEAMQDDFSPDYCYYESQRSNNIRGDNGATISGGIPVGKAGIAREIDLPYQMGYNPGRVTSAIRERAATWKMRRVSELKTVEECFDWVGTGQGSLDWGTVWPLPFVKGCLVKGLSRNARGGGHATCPGTLIRGETLMRLVPSLAGEVKPDEWVIQVANSHNVTAQFKGFYFVTMEGFADILAHPHTTVIGWSDMTVPQVRKFDFTKRSIFG